MIKSKLFVLGVASLLSITLASCSITPSSSATIPTTSEDTSSTPVSDPTIDTTTLDTSIDQTTETSDTTSEDPTTQTGTIEAKSISLSMHSEIIINKRSTKTLSVNYYPSNADKNIGITWTSSDSSVATVNPSTGLITGVSGGVAFITATTTNGKKAKAEVTIYDSSLSSGYKVTTTGVDTTVYEANSLMEASHFISMALVKHKTKVTVKFNFNNTTSAYDFINYYMELDSSNSITASTYSTGSGKTNVFSLSYYGSNVASIHSTPTETYLDLLHANSIVDSNSMNKRSADFDDFPINLENNGEIAVTNGEELWWTLSQGYKPTFASTSTKAYSFYQQAKSILREIISDDMNELEKIKAIYNYICDNSYYDYAALDYSGSWTNNTAYFIDGFFQYKTVVCDGFSKVMALFAGMENLYVVRGYGYDDESGHAWNYAKVEGKWYLVCPTWGQADINASESFNPTGYDTSFIDYGAFLSKSNYFSIGNFYPDQYIYPDAINDATVQYDKILEKEEFTYNDVSYDYYIDSTTELNAVFANFVDNDIAGDFYVDLQGKVTLTAVTNAINLSKMDYRDLSVMTSSTFGQTFYTVIVNM